MAAERHLRLAQYLADGVPAYEACLRAGWPTTSAAWIGASDDSARAFLAKAGLTVFPPGEPGVHGSVKVDGLDHILPDGQVPYEVPPPGAAELPAGDPLTRLAESPPDYSGLAEVIDDLHPAPVAETVTPKTRKKVTK